MDITEVVRQYIQKNHLLSQEGKYLVALSGGADSVTLLLVLQKLGYQIEACHCNFHLRGEESDRDENFCVDLCQRISVPLHRIHFDTLTYAKVHKVSIEMAARELRYHYFRQLLEALEADAICVAHHQDDSVETILINLIRGTGIKGLTGISPKNGPIVRPLLCVSRADILKYLERIGQEYVTDSTNLVDDVVRNKIRLNVIPMLKTIQPTVCQNILKTATYLQESQKMLEMFDNVLDPDYQSSKGLDYTPLFSGQDDERPVSWRDYGYIYINKSWVENAPSQEYVLHTALQRYGFASQVAEEIVASWDSVGKCWESPTHVLGNDRDYLIIQKKEEPFKGMILPEVGTYTLPAQSILIPFEEIQRNNEAILGNPKGEHYDEVASQNEGLGTPGDEVDKCGSELKEYLKGLDREQKIRLRISDRTHDFVPSKEAFSTTMDADHVHFPLTLRLSQEGDTFHPYGMKGRKLVSDYMTDKKKNIFEKKGQVVLTDNQGKILWLLGERISDDCKITESTRKVLRIEVNY